MTTNINSFGYFLPYPLWSDAVKLLDAQIKAKETNKYFNTLGLHYYEILQEASQTASSKQYYESRVASSLFFGMHNEFSLHWYSIPKCGLRMRQMAFLSYPMRLLFYSIGLYFSRLSQEHLIGQFNVRRKHIQTFYGGEIAYNNENLCLGTDHLYYRKYYQKYKTAFRKCLSSAPSSSVVLEFDVESCYQSISIHVLLELLDKNIKPSVKNKYRFDTNTVEQIDFFFRFIMNERRGIPSADNNIASAFIAHLYLSFADLQIDDLLSSSAVRQITTGHSIFRYVDDYKIILTFSKEISRMERADFVTRICSQIADLFDKCFDLSLNSNKTKIYWKDDDIDIDNLLRNLKLVSPGLPLPPDPEAGEDEAVQLKIDRIIGELTSIRLMASGSPFEHGIAINDEILKNIYDKHVQNLLKSRENRQSLSIAMKGFNFNFLKCAPRELTLIALQDDETAAKLRQFLLDMPALTTTDSNLIVEFLSQGGFKDFDLVTKLGTDPQYNPIIQALGRPNLNVVDPGYFDLTDQQVLKLCNMPNIMEQMRHRVRAEQSGSYSSALNHLQNEVHSLCRNLDNPNIKDYNVHAVANFLIKSRATSDLVTGVESLFDRRNHSLLSHPSSQHYECRSVAQDEYEIYRSIVANCFRNLL